MADILNQAAGQWPRLLMELGGLTPDQLTDTHQPCPACGGTDRYRWDRDDAEGGWFCNQCGGKDHAGGAGSGLDLLMRVRGWDYREAVAAVARHLGLPGNGDTPARTRKPGKPYRKPDKPPPDTPPPALGNAVAQWCYRDTNGEQLFWIQRFNLPDGRKLFIHRVWLDGGWHYPRSRGPQADPFTCNWPAPRPLYRLPDLVTRPDAPVMVVEGEKAADAAADLFPGHVVVSWSNGSKSIGKVDWAPLRGRPCVLWPDNDDEGRQAMLQLAGRLTQLGCAVQIADYPAESVPAKWDLADAAASGWTPETAAGAMGRVARDVKPPARPEPPKGGDGGDEGKPRPPLLSRVPSGAPFTCLGFDGTDYFYLPHRTGQVIRISGGGHKMSTLLMLADLPYWETLYPGTKESVSWPSAIGSLLATQAEIGVFDPDKVRGRGAWLDGDSVVFHLGDRLIIDSESYPVLHAPKTGYFYEQARHLDGPSAEALDDDDAMRLCLIAERFRWEVPASANFLLGWTVLAPVCGALNWRPHIWVTGGAGTGKTTILKSFMRPLMGGVLQTATGGTTEPGLRGILKSDAIPVVFDEFEQNEAKDKLIVQNILALARIASSEGGKIYKGTQTGGSNSFEIRSMFCVSSINVSLIQKADIDRFCVLGLRKDQMEKNEWLDFEQEILSVATVQNGRALIARTLSHLPTITKNARVLAQALGRRFGQRFGDQHGTLLSGAWSLRPGGGGPLTLEQAEQWIAEMDWDHQQPDPSESDEIKCRDTILQQIVRQGTAIDASFGEMVRCVVTQQSLRQSVWSDLVPVLGRYGLRVFRQGQTLPGDDAAVAQAHYLAIANSNAQLDQVLRNTPWSGGAHRAALRRITGAIIPNIGVHFAGVGTKRCVLVPLTEDDLTET